MTQTNQMSRYLSLELITNLPKLTLMNSALQLLLPFLMFRAQMMSLTLLPPLLFMSSVARTMASASHPSVNLEVRQLILLMCPKNALVPKNALSSAAQVSKSAQVSAAEDDEDSEAQTRQFKCKSKKSN